MSLAAVTATGFENPNVDGLGALILDSEQVVEHRRRVGVDSRSVYVAVAVGYVDTERPVVGVDVCSVIAVRNRPSVVPISIINKILQWGLYEPQA